jgi:hypothetical protein
MARHGRTTLARAAIPADCTPPQLVAMAQEGWNMNADKLHNLQLHALRKAQVLLGKDAGIIT